ncbi:MAG: hypothetical protein JNM00_15115 [Flavobacteriales bacterium]|nr:hypothetical protein [Flavobacteriales bacterium]
MKLISSILIPAALAILLTSCDEPSTGVTSEVAAETNAIKLSPEEEKALAGLQVYYQARAEATGNSYVINKLKLRPASQRALDSLELEMANLKLIQYQKAITVRDQMIQQWDDEEAMLKAAGNKYASATPEEEKIREKTNRKLYLDSVAMVNATITQLQQKIQSDSGSDVACYEARYNMHITYPNGVISDEPGKQWLDKSFTVIRK